MAEYHVENFGCRASRSDGEAIGAILRQGGMNPAGQAEAHVVIVNTCSVTAEADRQARAYLRRVRRQNPDAKVIVTGCYAQRAPAELAALPEVDAVVGNSHKSMVAELAAQFVKATVANFPETEVEKLSAADASAADPSFVPLASLAPRVFVDDSFAHSELASLPFAHDAQQTRPNLKVQDGCGNRCSFCIIPATRGPSRSVPLAGCVDNVRRFVEQGGQELVLSGINLGRWGRDLVPVQRLEELVAAILSRTPLPRLRLSSIEPMDWSAELLAVYREYGRGDHPRLARHAHLPLQSGSDAILRRMYRRYRPWHYAERLAQIRALLPDAAIGADVMIGFPGESDALFEESYRFIEAQPFTYLHLFPFSARPGTPAWGLYRADPVPVRAVQERMAALRALMAGKFLAFRRRFVGQFLSGITLEGEEQGAGIAAVTDNFLKLWLNGSESPNRLVVARISGLSEEGLVGSVAQGAAT